jgi:hypothetical protein
VADVLVEMIACAKGFRFLFGMSVLGKPLPSIHAKTIVILTAAPQSISIFFS